MKGDSDDPIIVKQVFDSKPPWVQVVTSGLATLVVAAVFIVVQRKLSEPDFLENFMRRFTRPKSGADGLPHEALVDIYDSTR